MVSLQLNTSAYLYAYDQYQDRIEIFNAVSNVALDQVQNAEEAQNLGVEFEVTWLASDSLTVGGNGSWAQTEYKSDFLVLEDDNPAFPVRVFNQFATGGRDNFLVRNLNGNDLKRIPEWKATVWAAYEWVFPAGNLTAGGTYAYTGEFLLQRYRS